MLTWRRLLSSLLSVSIFCTHCAFTYAAECNIWDERRRSSPRQPTQLAALFPTITPNIAGSSIANQLPAVAATLPGVSSWTKSNKKIYGSLPASLQTVINAIPPSRATIQDVRYSGDPKSPLVVLIQDVHMNVEAQANIASVLDGLIQQKQAGLVGIEGSFETLDFKPFRSFSDQKVSRQVADSFFRKNQLAAASYVGITSVSEPPPFVGVDDKKHYGRNVRAYLAARDLKNKISNEIADLERRLIEAKKNVFSEELKRFDDLRTAYHAGNVGIGSYTKKLFEMQSAATPSPFRERAGVRGKRSGHIVLRDALSPTLSLKGEGVEDQVLTQFLSAYEMESTLDFQRVETERKIVIEKLAKVLSAKESSELISQSLSYRMGQMSFGDYYRGLKNLCEKKGIHLRQTPAFDEYIRYVLLSDGIKADALFESVDRLEQTVLARLAISDDEKKLATISEQTLLMKKLIEFSLTSKEWERYKELSAVSSQLSDKNVKPFEAFYKEADRRSQLMGQNMLSALSRQLSAKTDGRRLTADSAAVLIVGGFHTPLVGEYLRRQKISYIVLTPKITKIEDASGNSYLSVFAQEKTPLDRLFEGEKLFLKPRMGEIDSSTGATMLGSMMARIGDLARLSVASVHFVFRNVPVNLAVTKAADPVDDKREFKQEWIFVAKVFALHLLFIFSAYAKPEISFSVGNLSLIWWLTGMAISQKDDAAVPSSDQVSSPATFETGPTHPDLKQLLIELANKTKLPVRDLHVVDDYNSIKRSFDKAVARDDGDHPTVGEIKAQLDGVIPRDQRISGSGIQDHGGAHEIVRSAQLDLGKNDGVGFSGKRQREQRSIPQPFRWMRERPVNVNSAPFNGRLRASIFPPKRLLSLSWNSTRPSFFSLLVYWNAIHWFLYFLLASVKRMVGHSSLDGNFGGELLTENNIPQKIGQAIGSPRYTRLQQITQDPDSITLEFWRGPHFYRADKWGNIFKSNYPAPMAALSATLLLGHFSFPSFTTGTLIAAAVIGGVAAVVVASRKFNRRRDVGPLSLLFDLKNERTEINHRADMSKKAEPEQTGRVGHPRNIVANARNAFHDDTADIQTVQRNNGYTDDAISRYDHSRTALARFETQQGRGVPGNHRIGGAGVQNESFVQGTVRAGDRDFGQQEGVGFSRELYSKHDNRVTYPGGIMGPVYSRWRSLNGLGSDIAFFWMVSRFELWQSTLPKFRFSSVYLNKMYWFLYFLLASVKRMVGHSSLDGNFGGELLTENNIPQKIGQAVVVGTMFLGGAAAFYEGGSLKKFDELFNRNSSAPQNRAQRSGLDGFGTVNRNNSAAIQINSMPENRVAAGLAQQNKVGFLQSTNDARSRNLGKVRHQAAMSLMSTSRFSSFRLSSLRDHKKSWMAFFMFLVASATVSPWLAQPGSSGAYTEYPPLGSFSITILYVTAFFLLTIVSFNPEFGGKFRRESNNPIHQGQPMLAFDATLLFAQFSFPKLTNGTLIIAGVIAGLAAVVVTWQKFNRRRGSEKKPEVGAQQSANPISDEEKQRVTSTYANFAEFLASYPSWREKNPTVKLVVLVRHIESMSNLFKYSQTYDFFSPPTLRGKKQALALAALLKDSNIQFDSYTTSDLERAYMTLYPLAAHNGATIKILKRLREVLLSTVGGVRMAFLEKFHPEVWGNFKRAPADFELPGHYSVCKFKRHASKLFFEEIPSSQDQAHVMVSHGMTIMFALMEIFGIPFEKYNAFWPMLGNPPHASVTVLALQAGRAPNLLVYGDDSYLGDELKGRTTSSVEKKINSVLYYWIAIARIVRRPSSKNQILSDYNPSLKSLIPWTSRRVANAISRDTARRNSALRPRLNPLEDRQLMSHGTYLHPKPVAAEVAHHNTAVPDSAAIALYRQNEPVFDAACRQLAAFLPANNVNATDFSSWNLNTTTQQLFADGAVTVGGRSLELTAVMDANTSHMISIQVSYLAHPGTMVGISANTNGGWDLFGQTYVNYTFYRDYLKSVSELGVEGTSEKMNELLVDMDSNSRMYTAFYTETQNIGPITVATNASPSMFETAVTWVSKLLSDLMPVIMANLQAFSNKIGGILDILDDVYTTSPTKYEVPELIDDWDKNWGGVTFGNEGMSVSMGAHDVKIAATIITHETGHLIQLDGFSPWIDYEEGLLYAAAMAQGLYKMAYANTDNLEYFAETTSFYSGVPGIYTAAGISALLSPVTFAAYDPAASAFLSEIYHASQTPLRSDLMDASFQGADAIKDTIEKSVNATLPRHQKAHAHLISQQILADRMRYTFKLHRPGAVAANMTVDAYFPRGQYEGSRRINIFANGKNILIEKKFGTLYLPTTYTVNGVASKYLSLSADLELLGRTIRSMVTPPRHARHFSSHALGLIVALTVGAAMFYALGGQGNDWPVLAFFPLIGMAVPVASSPLFDPQNKFVHSFENLIDPKTAPRFSKILFVLNSQKNGMVPLLYIQADRLTREAKSKALLSLQKWVDPKFAHSHHKIMQVLSDNLQGGPDRALRPLRFVLSHDGTVMAVMQFFGNALEIMEVGSQFRGRGIASEIEMAAVEEQLGLNPQGPIVLHSIQPEMGKILESIAGRQLSHTEENFTLYLAPDDARALVKSQASRVAARIEKYHGNGATRDWIIDSLKLLDKRNNNAVSIASFKNGFAPIIIATILALACIFFVGPTHATISSFPTWLLLSCCMGMLLDRVTAEAQLKDLPNRVPNYSELAETIADYLRGHSIEEIVRQLGDALAELSEEGKIELSDDLQDSILEYPATLKANRSGRDLLTGWAVWLRVTFDVYTAGFMRNERQFIEGRPASEKAGYEPDQLFVFERVKSDNAAQGLFGAAAPALLVDGFWAPWDEEFIPKEDLTSVPDHILSAEVLHSKSMKLLELYHIAMDGSRYDDERLQALLKFLESVKGIPFLPAEEMTPWIKTFRYDARSVISMPPVIEMKQVIEMERAQQLKLWKVFCMPFSLPSLVVKMVQFRPSFRLMVENIQSDELRRQWEALYRRALFPQAAFRRMAGAIAARDGKGVLAAALLKELKLAPLKNPIYRTNLISWLILYSPAAQRPKVQGQLFQYLVDILNRAPAPPLDRRVAWLMEKLKFFNSDAPMPATLFETFKAVVNITAIMVNSHAAKMTFIDRNKTEQSASANSYKLWFFERDLALQDMVLCVQRLLRVCARAAVTDMVRLRDSSSDLWVVEFLQMVDNDGFHWDVRAEAARALVRLTSAGHPLARHWLIKKLEPTVDENTFDRLDKLFSPGVPDEIIDSALRAAAWTNPRTPLVLLQVHRIRRKLLQHVVGDEKMDLAVRLVAFVFLSDALVNIENNKMADPVLLGLEKVEMMQLLEALRQPSIATLEERHARKAESNRRVAGIFTDFIGSQEAAIAETALVLIADEMNFSVGALPTFAQIAQFLPVEYRQNADSNFMFGARLLQRAAPAIARLFEDVVRHELFHNYLFFERGLRRANFTSEIFHEFLSDLWVQLKAAQRDMSQFFYRQDLRFASHFRTLSEKGFIAGEAHQAARGTFEALYQSRYPYDLPILFNAAVEAVSKVDLSDQPNGVMKIFQMIADEYRVLGSMRFSQTNEPRRAITFHPDISEFKQRVPSGDDWIRLLSGVIEPETVPDSFTFDISLQEIPDNREKRNAARAAASQVIYRFLHEMKLRKHVENFHGNETVVASLARDLGELTNNSFDENAAHVHLTSTLEQNGTRVDVVDDGLGFPPDILSLIGKQPVTGKSKNGPNPMPWDRNPSYLGGVGRALHSIQSAMGTKNFFVENRVDQQGRVVGARVSLFFEKPAALLLLFGFWSAYLFGGASSQNPFIGAGIGVILMILTAWYGLAQMMASSGGMNDEAASALAAFQTRWGRTYPELRASQPNSDLDQALVNRLMQSGQQDLRFLEDIQFLLASLGEEQRKFLFKRTVRFIVDNLKLKPGEPMPSMAADYARFKKESADSRIWLFFERIESRTFFGTVGNSGLVELPLARPLKTAIPKGSIIQLDFYRRAGGYYLELQPLLPSSGGASSFHEKFVWVEYVDKQGRSKQEFRPVHSTLSVNINRLNDNLMILLAEYNDRAATLDMVRSIENALNIAQSVFLAHLPQEVMTPVYELKKALAEYHIQLEFRHEDVLRQLLEAVRAHPEDELLLHELCREPFLLREEELSSLLSLPDRASGNILVEAQFSLGANRQLAVSYRRVGLKMESLACGCSLTLALRPTLDIDSVRHSLIKLLDEHGNLGDRVTDAILKNVEAELDYARTVAFTVHSPDTTLSVRRLKEDLEARHIQLEFRTEADLARLVKDIRKHPKKNETLVELCEGPFLLRERALDSLLSLSSRALFEPSSFPVLVEARFSLEADQKLAVSFRRAGLKEETPLQHYLLTPALRPELYIDSLSHQLIGLLNESGHLGGSLTVELLSAIEAGLDRVRALSLADLPAENATSFVTLMENLAARYMTLEFRTQDVLIELVEKIRKRSGDASLLRELFRTPFLVNGEELDSLLAFSSRLFSKFLSPHFLVAAQFSEVGGLAEVSYRRVGVKGRSIWKRRLLTPSLKPLEIDSLRDQLIVLINEHGPLDDIEAALDVARAISSAKLPPGKMGSFQKLERALGRYHLPLEARSEAVFVRLREEIRAHPGAEKFLADLCRTPFLLRGSELNSLLSLSPAASSEPLSPHVLVVARFSVKADRRLIMSLQRVGLKKESPVPRYVLTPDLTPVPPDILEQLISTNPLQLDKVFRSNPPGENSPFADLLRKENQAFEKTPEFEAMRSMANVTWTFEQRVAFVQGLALAGIAPQELSAVKETLFADVTEVKVLLQGTQKSFEGDKLKLNKILLSVASLNRPITVRVFVGRSEQAAKWFKTEFGAGPESPTLTLAFQACPSKALDSAGHLHLDMFSAGPLETLRGNVFFIGMSGVARFELSSPDGKENALREELLRSLQIAFIDDRLHVRELEGAVLLRIHLFARALAASA